MLQPYFAFSDPNAIITAATMFTLSARTPSGNTQTLSGFFMYSNGNIALGSSISGFSEYEYDGSLIYDITGFYMPIETWALYVYNNNGAGMRNYIFGGSDSLSGGSGNDRLMGLAGNDTINGNSGYDTAVYRGNLSDYTITKANGQITVTDLRGIDGTDTLTNIEALQFANATITTNSTTVVNGSDYTPGHNTTSVFLNTIVTFSDADGDALQQIEIFDNTPGGGRFRRNGVLQVENQGISIAPADFASYEFVTDGAVTNSVSFRAFDGNGWGAWTTFNINPRINALPTITAPGIIPGKNDAFIAGASLFSVTDGDGDAITRYRFYDGTVGNGRFVLNGVQQVELANFEIAASDLANFGFETSPAGASTLWVQANDGFGWGAWKSFTVAAVANVAPIANVQNLAPGKGTAFIAGSALVSVSDPDDASVVRYRFFDGTTGNGRFQLNGNDLVEQQNITVEAADFANFRFRTSTSGSDVLWVQAFDGTAWSAWKSFTVAAPTNVAPTVNVQNLTPAKTDAFIAGSTLFTASDPDDASVAKYRFFDGTAGNGRFQLNGQNQVELTNIEINAADLANFRYRVSTTGIGDTLWVQAYDGIDWGAWKSFTVAAPLNVVPVVSVQNLAPTRGTATLAAASLFSVTDGDGDTITAYKFFDGTAGSGHFRKNGTAQAELTNIDVSAAELATTDFELAGSGDVLWVQAFDGIAWSAWKSFTVLPPANNAPVVTVNVGSLNPGRGTATIAAASFFSTADADNDTITQFRFFDGDAGNGRFELNGAPEAELVNVTVDANDLANFTYRTSTTGVGDTLWVQAFDGIAWSAWKSFTVTAPANIAPIVNVQNVIPKKTDTFVAASTMFTVTDPDDAVMVKYRFYDSTIGNGYFSLNGTAQPELANFEISGSDLANLRFETSTTGIGGLAWVQAYDGFAWSEWKSFSILAPFNFKPIVNVHDLTYLYNTPWVTGSALFTVSDPDSPTMVRYRFYDGTAGNGHFQLNGVVQLDLHNITVEAADLANFGFGINGLSTDQLWVQAYDGYDWSDWKSFNASALGGPSGLPSALASNMDGFVAVADEPGSGTINGFVDAPVVTASDATVVAGATTSVSALLGATDPNGDAITAWRLWDDTTGGGAFRIGGAAQPDHQPIDVMADQLASVEFLAGNTAGTDTLWARASDGTGWGEWKMFTITNLAPV